MLQPRNELGDCPGVTQNSYRRAVASVIRNIQAAKGESDQDTADRLGCSSATICNARNEKGSLAAETWLKIGREYGLEAIAPIMFLITAKAAPIQAVCTSDRELPVYVAEGQMFLAKALSDNDQVDDHEIAANPAAIEHLAQVGDVLRWRLNSLRARGLAA